MNKRFQFNKIDAGQTFLSSICIPYAVALIITTFATIMNLILGQGNDITKSSAFDVVYSLSAQMAFAITIILIWRLKKVDMPKALNLSCSKKQWPNFLISILMGGVLLFGLADFVNLFGELLNTVGYSQPATLPFPLDSVGWLVLNIIALAVLPAILEEIVFRGIIINGFKAKMGEIASIFFSAFLFTIMHGSPLQTIYPFLLGLVLGFISVKTKSIIFPMIVHFLNNLTVVLFTYFNIELPSLLKDFSFKEIAVVIVISIVAIAIIFGLGCILLKRNGKLSKLEFQPKDKNTLQTETDLNLESPQTETSQETIYNRTQNRFPNYFLLIGILFGCASWIYTLLYYLGVFN